MTLFRRSTSLPSDSQIDGALHDLFAPAARPRFRTGFERRVTHNVAIDIANRHRSRKLRRVLRAYWIGTAVVSLAIVWQLQDQLMSGPGLWVSVAGLATLLGASLLLSILAALPVRLGRRIRSPRG